MAPPIDGGSFPIFHPAGAVLFLVVALGLGYPLWTALYNIFFHPLRKYPGPKLWAITRIPYTRASLSGRGHRRILELHQKYGPIVRVAPDSLSYNHPMAWKEIRGHRKNGKGEHGKDRLLHQSNTRSIIGANREDHTRFRRALAHGFSAQAMLDQQPIIKEYVDRLFQKLHEQCANGTRPLNMVGWFNYTTFDIIGDLAFGEPFGCLQDSAYHPWVSLVFEGVKNLAILANIRHHHPVIRSFLMYLIPKELTTKWAQHTQLSHEKVRKRLSMKTDRPDFTDSMTKKRGVAELTFEEIASNASTLIIAGSETTATVLSAATYYLTSNPDTLARLTNEVRSSFSTEDEIDLLSVQKLSYMLAVLDETMRMYPPVPAGSPRRIAEGGDMILGGYVPYDTIVEIWQWPMYHNPAHFTLPDSFIPERWLDDPRFVNDKKEAFQPFSVGPRNCIGRNLAYSEMRLILARLVWNFDLKLAEESKGWDDRSLVYLLWEKGPFNVYVTPRKTE